MQDQDNDGSLPFRFCGQCGDILPLTGKCATCQELMKLAREVKSQDHRAMPLPQLSITRRGQVLSTRDARDSPQGSQPQTIEEPALLYIQEDTGLPIIRHDNCPACTKDGKQSRKWTQIKLLSLPSVEATPPDDTSPHHELIWGKCLECNNFIKLKDLSTDLIIEIKNILATKK